MTISYVKKRAKELGVKAKWSSDDQEWDVEGYFTDCHEDALSHIEYIAGVA